MTADREEQTKKDLLWEYTKALTALEAMRVTFRETANKFDSTAKILRNSPEKLVNFDFKGLREELETTIAAAKEYSDMLAENAQRKRSLIEMRVISS